MKLALTSAILPEMTFEEVVGFLAENKIPGIEPMCWPTGSGDKRKYAGVAHIDVTKLDAGAVLDVLHNNGQEPVTITALGYYPNPLTPDRAESPVVIEHLKNVIRAARILGVDVVNTFVGRDWTQPVKENWKRFRVVWAPLVSFAEDQGVAIAIENCPMRFTSDEWPGGKNMASSPAVWRQMFEEIPSLSFGLNFDPSHLVLQNIDIVRAVEEFGPRIFHVHAKDLQVDEEGLYRVGVLADNPKDWHTPKLPGYGQVPWSPFFDALRRVGYNRWVSIEVEDPAFVTLEERQQAVKLSRDFLGQFLAEPQPAPGRAAKQ